MADIMTSSLARSPDAAESRVGDETVLLHLKSSTYFGLDRLGTRIWELLHEGMAPSAICQLLHMEFDAELAVLEDHTRRFLLELEAHDIIARTECVPETASRRSD